MRIIMILLGIIGTFVLVVGITTWVGVINNEGVVDTFISLTFGIAFTIMGGVILLIDLIILLIYLNRKKKKSL